jgi:hypothetical protein
VDLEVILIETVKQQIEIEDAHKLLEFLLAELVSYFEHLVDNIPEKLWITLLYTLKWSSQFKNAGSKHLEKSNPNLSSIQNNHDNWKPQDQEFGQSVADPIHRVARHFPNQIRYLWFDQKATRTITTPAWT